MPISTDADLVKAKSAYDFVVLDSKKNEYDLSIHEGNVTLFVNVASHCALFTKDSYSALTILYEHYKNRGFSVIGFPSNQFFHEPDSEEQVEKFACTKFNATFPLMAKIEVNGDNASPLWKWLKEQKPGSCGIQAIKWNFTSFLVDKCGNVVERFSPGVTVEDVEDDLVGALSSKGAYQKKESTCC